MKPLQNRAFTLVELLVVIAIIGILVGLLLPAVQSAREAARRCQCMNNMVQAGLAVHHYEFSMEHLPAGTTAPEGPIHTAESGNHVSWIVRILPYLEQGPLYEIFDQEAGVYAPVNREPRAAEVKSLLCPSDPGAYYQRDQDAGKLGHSNYAGCHHDVEAPIDVDNNGLLFLNSDLRYSQIPDGSTQTILLGEKIIQKNGLGWASGTRATLRNTGELPYRPNWNELNTATPTNDPLQVGGFGSWHPGGALFTFADGSVHYLSENIEPKVYQNLGNRHDGEVTYDW